MKGFFITGTDTSIGKTVVATILGMGLRAKYWKPIQTGSIDEKDSDFARKWLGASQILPELYIFPHPLSPHLAASASGSKIDLQKINDAFNQHLKSASDSPLVVEGAGGVLVPLNDDVLMIDLIKQLDLSVIIVTSSKLGTINHTLLTIEALRSRSIRIGGVVINGIHVQETEDSISRYGCVNILGRISHCPEFKIKWFNDQFSKLKGAL